MSLLRYLEEHGVDVFNHPASYYVGGLENRCQVVPKNVIVFFMHHPCLQKDTMPNFHHRYQVKINLGGESIFGVDELRFRMGTDTGMMIFPFQTHYVVRGDAPPERHHMTISFTVGGDGGASLMALRNHPFGLDRRDLELLEAVASAYQNMPEESESEAVALLTVFLSRKLEEVSRQPDCGVIRPENPLFGKLFSCVRNDLAHCSREKDLAERLGVSESHLRKLVREYFNGITLGQMLTLLKFGYARELLAYSDQSIGEIAETCGYADAFSFSRAFHRHSGLSPSAFRQNMGTRGRQ